MPRTLEGEFSDRASAERALAQLRAADFDPQHMSLVSQEREEGEPPPHQQVAHSLGGSLLGSLIGICTGALIAWLTSLLVHGLVSITTAGVLVCAIVGGVIGWFLGGLAGSGKPLEEGEYRQERVELGRMQLTLDPGTREAVARDILQRFGARNVHRLGDLNTRDDTGLDDSQHALT